MLEHQPLTLLVAVLTLVLTVLLYIVVPKGFFPVQDTGLIQAISDATQSISYPAMAERQQALAAAIPKDPDVVQPVVSSSASTAPMPPSTADASSST